MRKCKDIVKTLHYKADMLETEVKDTNNETAAKAFLKKIDEAFEVEMKSNNSEGIGIEIGYDEICVSVRVDVCDTDIGIGSTLEYDAATTTADSQIKLKRVYRLQSEMPVRWNSLLAMLNSLSSMRKETDNCLKMIGQYDKCLKASEWQELEELRTFLYNFQDFTDIVCVNVTSLSLLYLIRKEIALLCVENENDSEDVASLKRSIIRSLDKRMPLTNSVQLATFLEPSTSIYVTCCIMKRLICCLKQ